MDVVTRKFDALISAYRPLCEMSWKGINILSGYLCQEEGGGIMSEP